MPRVKKKSTEQRAREQKKAYKAKKECVERNVRAIESGKAANRVSKVGAPSVADSVESAKRALVDNQINAAADDAEHSGLGDGKRGDEREVEVMKKTPTREALCNRLKKFALTSPHPSSLPANEPLPDAIAEHVQLVQAIIESEVGEASLRDLVDPVGWLDAQTIYAYLEALAASASVAVLVVQPYIWMLRVANAECVPPYRYVRHYVRNYVDDWELVLLPIVLPGHHVLGVYRRSTNTFEYYDSLLNPISLSTRSAVSAMLDALHPGVQRVFVNSSDVVRQHDSSSCGVIVCFTASEVIAGRPTNDIAFDSMRWRLVIYNTITAQRGERERSANANSTHTTGTAHADRVPSGHAVCENATRSSTLRTRTAKRSGQSVDGIGTPKRVATSTRARKWVAPENAANTATRKQFRAAGAELPKSFRLGSMNKPCPNCAAVHFAKEAFVCCSGGR
ncbi:unnamed protein product, partial [Toxocara canis]|uniref:ULP_PROTEASE domain-containing protein n=1 Tax=Toxocara canis TaxID=6265 RepID=A0A183VDI9_TOXCA